MSLRARISVLWHDPVGSNLIAGVIITGVGSLGAWWLNSSRMSLLMGHPVVSFTITLFALALVVLLWHGLRHTYKTLVFLSAGGTCRDPIAKAITLKLLEARKPKPRIEVRAAGLGPISKQGASYAARYVIREMYDEDLLKDHRPELLTLELVKQADLILAMDKALLLTPDKILPKEKTFLLKEFFGLHGDVVDPFPDGKDPVTLQRYRECANEIRTILTENIDNILKVLRV
jgi:protein-tyrosine-phosphatase